MAQRDSLSITDNRTGKSYEVAISDGTIKALDLRQIKTEADDFGLMTYDPGFTNTASCRSSITFIDGDKGILRHGGYPIEELAERASFLEVSYLLYNGELPTGPQLDAFTREVMQESAVPENIKALLTSFRQDAHPMGKLIASVSALGTFYPEAQDVLDPAVRRRQMVRLLGQVATLAAWGYRQSKGLPFVEPNPALGFTENFYTMMMQPVSGSFKVDPDIVKALDVLFTLHADHEQNCSTNTMRSIGSSQADPYSAVAGATAALFGPLHGGANAAVLKMLHEIGSVERVPEFMKSVKEGTGGRLMGFGHRVYKNYDPRARVIKSLADRVFELVGQKNPLLQIAQELEKIALADEYFAKRKLYPNVDFYSGLIYEVLNIPVDMFTVLFAVARTAGWLAQWEEMLLDKDQKIARPRQIYTGHVLRSVKPLSDR
jgi:citrate synthase